LTKVDKEDALSIWKKYKTFKWFFRYTMVIYVAWLIAKLIMFT